MVPGGLSTESQLNWREIIGKLERSQFECGLIADQTVDCEENGRMVQYLPDLERAEVIRLKSGRIPVLERTEGGSRKEI